MDSLLEQFLNHLPPLLSMNNLHSLLVLLLCMDIYSPIYYLLIQVDERLKPLQLIFFQLSLYMYLNLAIHFPAVNTFYEGMVTRSEEMKLHPNYRTGENYAYLGLAPQFLIFDEYVAFLEMLTTKESTALLSQLKKIVMLGRQAGYFLIVACQRPDAKYFGDGIRDNFNFRVGLGRMSELGYGMLFGSDVKKQFFQKRIKGRGYCDVGTSVISEFYTPLVPKGYDFLGTIGELAERRTEKKALEQSEALL